MPTPAAPPPPRLIALDWGTSSARAWLLGAEGVVLDRTQGPWGILQVDGDFAGALAQLCGRWRTAHPGIPMLAAGMIGSRQGWAEAPYAQTPAGLAELAAGLRTHLVEGGTLAIVPGIAQADPPDVMRGEETQLAGLDPHGERLCVLPGTHNKWVRVRDGRITQFTTCMTGELFAVLRQHSILGRTMVDGDAEASQRGFEAGLREGMESASRPGGLVGALFALRAGVLLERFAATEQAERLSGLLIGAEVASMQAQARAASGPVVLVGDPALCGRYARALELAGVASEAAPADVAALGLWRIATAAGLLD